MNFANRKVLFLVIGAALVAIITIFAIAITAHPAGQAVATPTPASTPLKSETSYYGIETLVSHGLSATQAEDLKFGFHKYFTAARLQPGQVSLYNVNTQYNFDTGDASMTFDLRVDNTTTRSGRIAYDSLDTLQLIVFDKGVQVYDTGVIKVAAPQ